MRNNLTTIPVSTDFVMSRSTAQLQMDRSWLAQNNLSIAVDMSRLLNVVSASLPTHAQTPVHNLRLSHPFHTCPPHTAENRSGCYLEY